MPLLLEAGADPNNCQPLNHIKYANDEWEKDSRGITRLLLGYGADPNAQDSEGDAGLLTAAQHGNLEAVKLILKHGGNPLIRNNNGETSLTRSIKAIIRPWYRNKTSQEDHDEIVIHMLKHSDAHKSFVDRYRLLKEIFDTVLGDAIAQSYAKQPHQHPITSQRLKHWASLGEESWV